MVDILNADGDNDDNGKVGDSSSNDAGDDDTGGEV